jgi:ribosome-associated protein
MLRITPTLSIPEEELQEEFLRSSGPGGQHVNKSETAVRLRFDARNSASLSEDVRERALRLAGNRATDDGEILIDAQRHRSQERNRHDARKRLAELLERAARPPKKRKKKRVSKAQKEKRLQEKRKRSEKKKQRGSVRPNDY